MKKLSLITSFIGLHIFFIALQIHKQSNFIKLTYHKQHLEQTKQSLISTKHQYQQQYAALSNPCLIKKYARHTLGLQFMKLQQLKRLHDETCV